MSPYSRSEARPTRSRFVGRQCQQAKDEQIDVLVLDTAGRLAIDQELMDQLTRIDRQVHPDQAYLVVDGMTGQDAVNSARAFNEALELDGVILTKLDGDARGGAVLSVKHVTGVPIKFIGTGERLDSLEPFRPEGMAGRILGMGDVVEMVRTAQQEFDQDQLAATEERLRKGEFTLEDFRKQLAQIARPGLMQKMMTLMPGMGELGKMMDQVDAEQDMKRLFGIIDSMTPEERRNPKLIDASRPTANCGRVRDSTPRSQRTAQAIRRHGLDHEEYGGQRCRRSDEDGSRTAAGRDALARRPHCETEEGNGQTAL